MVSQRASPRSPWNGATGMGGRRRRVQLLYGPAQVPQDAGDDREEPPVRRRDRHGIKKELPTAPFKLRLADYLDGCGTSGPLRPGVRTLRGSRGGLRRGRKGRSRRVLQRDADGGRADESSTRPILWLEAVAARKEYRAPATYLRHLRKLRPKFPWLELRWAHYETRSSERRWPKGTCKLRGAQWSCRS